MTWVELLIAAVFLTAAIVRALRTPPQFAEALIDTAIGLGAAALGISALTRGLAADVLAGVGVQGLATGLALLFGRRLRTGRTRPPGP